MPDNSVRLLRREIGKLAAMYGRENLILAVHTDDEQVAREEGLFDAADELGLRHVVTANAEPGAWTVTTAAAIDGGE